MEATKGDDGARTDGLEVAASTGMVVHAVFRRHI